MPFAKDKLYKPEFALLANPIAARTTGGAGVRANLRDHRVDITFLELRVAWPWTRYDVAPLELVTAEVQRKYVSDWLSKHRNLGLKRAVPANHVQSIRGALAQPELPHVPDRNICGHGGVFPRRERLGTFWFEARNSRRDVAEMFPRCPKEPTCIAPETFPVHGTLWTTNIIHLEYSRSTRVGNNADLERVWRWCDVSGIFLSRGSLGTCAPIDTAYPNAGTML
ncbi:hypothetical protein BKA62DRAFT_678831 [Auriculariales sp. MPI-PUGE-AT-0066]|nr:hypothetical protein BKA62DRAFT_678831 [Auriculariales sp. MPI-PUGE-AT-0066]